MVGFIFLYDFWKNPQNFSMIERISLEEWNFWNDWDSIPWSLRHEKTEINTQKDHIIIEKNPFFKTFISNLLGLILNCRNYKDKWSNNWQVLIFASTKFPLPQRTHFLVSVMDNGFWTCIKKLIWKMLVNIKGWKKITL